MFTAQGNGTRKWQRLILGFVDQQRGFLGGGADSDGAEGGPHAGQIDRHERPSDVKVGEQLPRTARPHIPRALGDGVLQEALEVLPELRGPGAGAVRNVAVEVDGGRRGDPTRLRRNASSSIASVPKNTAKNCECRPGSRAMGCHHRKRRMRSLRRGGHRRQALQTRADGQATGCSLESGG
jgi:hypothetical protein